MQMFKRDNAIGTRIRNDLFDARSRRARILFPRTQDPRCKTDNERKKRVRDHNTLCVIYYLYRILHVRVVVLLQHMYVRIVTRTSIKYLIGPLFGMRRPIRYFFLFP